MAAYGPIEHPDFHWLVGILEGEGSFIAGSPSSPHTPQIRVVMTDDDIVERVAGLLGRAMVPLRKREGRKPAYVTAIKGSVAVDLMQAVRPTMSARRTSQIDRAIGSWNGVRRRRAMTTQRCPAPGCTRRVETRGLCRHHYKLWWKAMRHGRTPRVLPELDVIAFRPIDVAECTSECDVHWLAGLLEGEGTFSLNRYADRCYPALSVHMTDEDTMQRAAGLLGASGVWPVERGKEHWSPSYATSVSGHAGSLWMVKLHPLMGDRRRDAIERALAEYQPVRVIDPPARCVVIGCGEPHRSRGLCHKHYMSWMRDRARGREPRVTGLR